MFGHRFFSSSFYGPRYFGPAGVVTPTGGVPSKRRSTARKKKKEAVLGRVEIELILQESGGDVGLILGETIYLPVMMGLSVREEALDEARIILEVAGIGYDEDDLEALALAMSGY